METSVLADKQKPTFISSVQIQGTPLRTYQKGLPIETDDEKKARESVLPIRLDDDDDDDDDVHLL